MYCMNAVVVTYSLFRRLNGCVYTEICVVCNLQIILLLLRAIYMKRENVGLYTSL
jgi:hypothetical protein